MLKVESGKKEQRLTEISVNWSSYIKPLPGISRFWMLFVYGPHWEENQPPTNGGTPQLMRWFADPGSRSNFQHLLIRFLFSIFHWDGTVGIMGPVKFRRRWRPPWRWTRWQHRHGLGRSRQQLRAGLWVRVASLVESCFLPIFRNKRDWCLPEKRGGDWEFRLM